MFNESGSTPAAACTLGAVGTPCRLEKHLRHREWRRLSARYSGSGLARRTLSHSARRYEASEPISRCSPRRPSASNSACSTTTGTETRVDLPEMTALCWHGYVPGRAARAAVRIPRARAVGARAGPLVQPRRSCCWIRTRRRSTARGRGTRRCSRITSTNPRRSRNDLDSAPFMPEVGGRSIRLRLGQRSAAATPWHRTVVYETHVKGFTQDASRAARGTARHLRRAGASRRHRVSAEARRHRGRAAARAPVRAGLARCSSAGCATTGATTRSATSRRTTSTPRAGSAASRCRSSRTLVKALHDAGIEVILDVVYNHTAEGNHLGPILSFKGIDNARLLPADVATTAATTWTTPAPGTR